MHLIKLKVAKELRLKSCKLIAATLHEAPFCCMLCIRLRVTPKTQVIYYKKNRYTHAYKDTLAARLLAVGVQLFYSHVAAIKLRQNMCRRCIYVKTSVCKCMCVCFCVFVAIAFTPKRLLLAMYVRFFYLLPCSHATHTPTEILRQKHIATL